MSNKSTKKINLSLRHARLKSIGTSRERHGEESVPKNTFTLCEIELTKKEVDKLAPTFHAAFFNTDGDLVQPNFPQFKPVESTEIFEDAVVRFVPGVDKTHKGVEVEGCRLSKISFTPVAGGATHLQVSVYCDPPGNLMRMLDALDGTVYVEISDATIVDEEAKKAQQVLALNAREDGDDDQPRAH